MSLRTLAVALAQGALVALPEPSLAQTLLTLESPNARPFGSFGAAVSGIGDPTGDGVPELVVGAPYEVSEGEEGSGRAYVFDGSTGTVLYSLSSPEDVPRFSFGFSLADVPDVDGDGADDLLVGAPDRNRPGSGWAYLFSGASGRLIRILTSPNEQNGGEFGYSVASSGDVNGDGIPDLLVGARFESTSDSPTHAGRVYIFSGSDGTLLRTLTSPAEHPFGYFGAAIASVGDVDADESPDILVGAYHEGFGSPGGTGRAHLFNGATGTHLVTLVPPNDVGTAAFAAFVAGPGDLNGDGIPDLLVSNADGTPPGPDLLWAGRAYVFSGLDGELLRTLISPNQQAGGLFGAALEGISDVDYDGTPDILVGAFGEETGGSPENSGRAYVLSGATGQALLTFASPDEQEFGEFGNAVASAGDIDGDGAPDVLIGAYGESSSSGVEYTGRAYVFSGTPRVPVEPEAPTPVLTLIAVPNPARQGTALRFMIPAAGFARLAVYDALGRVVAVLVDGVLAAGSREVTFDGAALPPGVYLARLSVEGETVTRTLTLVR